MSSSAFEAREIHIILHNSLGVQMASVYVVTVPTDSPSSNKLMKTENIFNVSTTMIFLF